MCSYQIYVQKSMICTTGYVLDCGRRSDITVNNYFEWGILAVIALVVVLIPMLIIDIIFYYRQLLTVKTKVIKIFRKK